jgi:hypothetical protein
MVIPALLIGGAVGLASAKLPPLSDEAKAKAADAKAKSAEAAKKDAAALAKAQDRAAAHYKKEKGGKVTPVAATAKPKKK